MSIIAIMGFSAFCNLTIWTYRNVYQVDTPINFCMHRKANLFNLFNNFSVVVVVFFIGKQKSRSVRFSERSDSNEGIIVHEVQSANNLRRLLSWNSNLTTTTDNNKIPRNSESDSSLSSTKMIGAAKNTTTTTTVASSISPGKNQVFRISPEQHLSGGSPDSDVSSEFALSRGPSLSQYTVPVTQESYLQNEMKFVSKELEKVRDSLNDKVRLHAFFLFFFIIP